MADRKFRIIFEAANLTGKAFAKINGNLKKTQTSATEVGTALVALGSALSAPFLIGLKSAAQLQDQLARTRGIFRATEADFKRIEKAADEMGRTTRFTATQAAEALQFMAMAGLSVNEALTALPSTLQLAQAGALDLGTAADITTNILTAYRFEAEELARVNDVLVAAFTSSNTTLQELGEGFKFVAPIARGLNSDFEDLIAAFGKLADNGIKASVAGTTLRGTLSALFNPTAEEARLMDDLSRRIGGTGLQIKTQEGNFVGFAKLIEQLEDAGLRADEALKLFGLRAGPGIAALLGVGSEALKEMTTELKNSEGAAQEMSDLMKETLVGSVKELQSALDGLLRQIASQYIPKITELARGLAALINTIIDVREAMGPLTGVIDTVVLSFAALAAGAGALTLAYKFLIAPVIGLFSAIAGGTAVAGVLTAIGTALSGVVVALAALVGPALAVVAAIAAVGVAVYKLYKLVDAIAELNKQNRRLIETQAKLDESRAKLEKMISKARKETGLYIRDLSHLHALMREGKIIYDETTKAFKEIKDAAAESAKAELEAQRARAQAAVANYDFRTKLEQEFAKRQSLEVQGLAAENIITEKEAAEKRVQLSLEALERQKILASEYYAAAGILYAKDSEEYQAAVLEKEKADNKYFEALIKKVAESKKQAEELQKAQFETGITREQEDLRTQLAELEALYAQGKRTSEVYFSEKAAIAEEAYNIEREALEKLIETAATEAEQIRLRGQLHTLEEKRRRDLIRAEQDQLQTERELLQVRRDLDQTIADAQARQAQAGIAVGETENPLIAQQALEMEALQNRHAEELRLLEELTVAKELEAEKQIAIRELQAAQEMEIAARTADNERALLEQRRQIAQQSANAIGGIFNNLYELSGEKIKAFFILSRAAAAAEAIINAEVAATKVLAQLGAGGAALAAATRIQGYTAAALIAAQTFEGLADGGLVGGSSPNSKADDKLIWATSGEFMHPVSTVGYYGVAAMERLRNREIPREALYAPDIPDAYANGGAIAPSGGQGGGPSVAVNVPLTVAGGPEGLGGRLREAVEELVISILNEELNA